MELKNLYDPRSKYSPEQKLDAVMHYVVSGSLKYASNQTGIPSGTVRQWKNRSAWWGEAVNYCRKLCQDRLDGKLTGIMNRMTEEIIDRIENGDEVIFQGRKFNKKMSGKDLTTSLAILYDKRALARGDPTSRTERRDVTKELERLQKEFEKLFPQMNESKEEETHGRGVFQGEKAKG